MSNTRTIAKNFIVLSLAHIISLGLSLVLVILITRFLGSVGYGKLGFAMSLAAVLTILTPLGLDSLMIREVARHRGSAAKYLGNTLVIELLLSIVAFAFIALAVFIMRLPSDSAVVLYIAGGYCILTIFSNTMKCIFRAHEKMEYDALLGSIRSLVTVAIGAAVLLLGYGLVAVTLAYLAAAAIDLALTLLITLKRFVRPKLDIDFAFWKKMIPLALPFAALSVTGVIYGQIDVIVLKGVQGDAVVGWFKAAFVLASTFGVIPSILSSAIFPVLSRFHISSKDSLRFTVQQSTKYLMILGFPIAAGIALLATPIITLVYGADFSPAAPALRILTLYIPFSFLNSTLGVMLASVDKQRLRLFCYLASTVARVGLLLLLLLVFRLSLTGAAIAIVASEALLFALNYYYSARHIKNLNLFGPMLKPFLATMGMAALVFCLLEINLILLVALAAIAYFALFFALRGIDGDDRAMMKEIWRGIRRTRVL
jgi:O-antigen/teichoic acid export membrane protein